MSFFSAEAVGRASMAAIKRINNLFMASPLIPVWRLTSMASQSVKQGSEASKLRKNLLIHGGYAYLR